MPPRISARLKIPLIPRCKLCPVVLWVAPNASFFGENRRYMRILVIFSFGFWHRWNFGSIFHSGSVVAYDKDGRLHFSGSFVLSPFGFCPDKNAYSARAGMLLSSVVLIENSFRRYTSPHCVILKY